MDPGASGPNAKRLAAGVSRLRRRAPAIPGSADRRRPRAADRRSRRVRQRRMRVAPRKARPFVPGRRVVSDSRGTNAMSTDQPLSLTEAKRLAPNTDTILLRATRPADLETPIGAFLRLDDGGPAYLLESVEGGERLGRYSFLGDRTAAPARGARRPRSHPDPPARCRRVPPRPRDRDRAGARSARGHPPVRPAPPHRPDRGHAAIHRRRRRRARLRRGVDLRADRPAAGARSGRGAHGRLHRNRPRDRVRPPDPHDLGDRLAAHRSPGPGRPLPDRRGGDLRGARTHGATKSRRS